MDFKLNYQVQHCKKNVFIFCNEEGHFSDNYFDLLSHQTKIIEFKTESSSLNTIEIKTLNTI